MELARPGDIVCRRYVWYLDGYFIKGEYTHSGIVVNTNTIIHAVAEGVTRIDIIDYVKDADGFVLLRPINTAEHPYDPALAIFFACGMIGKPYDFVFQSGPDAFYCHELAYYAIMHGGKKVIKPDGYMLYEDVAKECAVLYTGGDP